jgi:hypothetical protein
MKETKICEYCDAIADGDGEVEHETWCPELLNKVQNVQESDTTDDDSSNGVDNIIK